VKEQLTAIKNLSDGQAQKILADIYVDYYRIGRNSYTKKDFMDDLKNHFGEGFIRDIIYRK